MTYLKKLQNKSEGTRKQILIVSLISCMAFVGLVWVYTLGYRFNSETAVKTDDSLKPFSLFANSISDAYDNITASVGNIPKQEDANTKSEKQIDLIPVEPKTNQ